MERYAVIGQPVGHSLSPRIHALFAAQTGQALGYEAIEVAADVLAATLARLHAEGYSGLNVTLPHKLAAMALCGALTERASLAGAVNTLSRTGEGWAGDNTDGTGCLADLQAQGMNPAGKRVLVLGSGGAARGILKPLLDAKPAELVLSNRNPWKPEELAEQFKPHGAIRPCTHLALKGDLFDLVINATSAGHAGQAVKLPFQLLAPGAACYDLSYGKVHAPFRAWATEQGAAKIADGLGMLVEQAALAFELWRGVRPQTAPVLQELRR
ncbi:MAG TPA: shikimate dehydrogenase [Solimonas sp.]|nr:shikimate dehydrogenase [Solimonas sp.]